MASISSSVGLVSGINTGDIINQLMAIESRPKDLLQSRVDNLGQQKLAFTDLSTRLTSLRINGQALNKPSTFQSASATSSNESAVTATTTTGATVGSYQLQVARLVTTQQIVSRGYEDFNSSKVGAGTITLGVGGGELTRLDNLSDLNGGNGVRRGQFRITDRAGHSAIIDTTAAVTLQDVVKKINTSLDVQVHATISGDKLQLDDLSGKTDSNLIVQDVGDGHAAADLGLVANAAANTVAGTDINYLGLNTSLSLLNDGRGVAKASSGGDFTIQPGDGGAAVTINLAGLSTVGDVIQKINTASAGRVTATINPGDNHLTLTDASGGTVTVAAIGTTTAARDLGILGSGNATLTGADLLSGLGTVLVSSLNGGQGITLGTIAIKDRASTASVDVDLSAAKTVQDILDTLNNATGVHIHASITAAGDGIQIEDTSGGTDLLQIDDANGGTTAQTLGIAGSFDATTAIVKGANLHRQYVSESTLLKDYNGGKGVNSGAIKITNSNGTSATIGISSNQVNIGDVISQINARGLGVTASINANGNGLLLTDTAGGPGKLKVADVDGTAAKDLLIAGESTTGTTIDGAQEKTIDVTGNDTLATLQTKINNLNFGVSANVINDGSSLAPYRLSLTSKNTGRNGRVVFDTGTTTLDSHNLVEAQDAAVFLGGAGSEQPLLITSSSNQIAGAIKGVTLNLNSVSDSPVQVNVSRTPDAAIDQVNQFVSTFNDLTDKIADLTKFDTDTNTAGLLLGDATVQTIQDQIYSALNTVVPNNGKLRILGDIGVSIGDGGKLAFDEDKFRAAFADDADGVSNLFSSTSKSLSLATNLQSINDNAGVRTAGGGIADLHFILHNKTEFDVSLSSANTIQDILDAINTASAGKVKANIGLNGNLTLTDSTSGGKAFSVSSLNGSSALHDLGLDEDISGSTLTGRRLIALDTTAQNIGGALVDRINRLIDPINGALTQESHELDDRTQQFQSRIDDLNTLLDQKRARLQEQFANMESVLGKLQSQQSALGSFTPVKASTSSSK